MKKNIFVLMIFLGVLAMLLGCTQNKHDTTQINTGDSSASDKQTEYDIDTEKNDENATQPPLQYTPLNYENLKAVWLSQFDLTGIYTKNGSQRNENDYRSRIKQVLSNVKNDGFNTVIVQTRPYADSFYPSDVFPPSRYVTGSYSNSFLYDPISILIEEAHTLDLSVQGWINPLRCMTADEIKQVNDKYQIKKWYNDSTKNSTYLVEYNNRYYLNPAYPEVRQLIVSGVSEMISTYQFDGIHMDDYFYPTTDLSFDRTAFADALKKNDITLKQFRYGNLNSLIREIYKTIKAYNPNLIYGISPEGNITNATEKSYADVYTWCSEDGYIDYICPQIYFGLEHQTLPFDKTSKTWSNIITSTNVKLYIGITLGKAYSKTDQWAGSGKDEWADNNDVIKRCLETTTNIDNCCGVAFFCYQYFYVPTTGQEVAETKNERDNFLPILKDILWN